jgi:uncharacterized spore protein YtfJ
MITEGLLVAVLVIMVGLASGGSRKQDHHPDRSHENLGSGLPGGDADGSN